MEFHQRTQHFDDRRDAKIFTCDANNCNLKFSKLYQLNNHKLKKHSTDRYKCSFCNKGFKEKRKLSFHQRIHLNDRKEICKFCKKKFTDPSTLRQHINNVHDDVPKQYLCKKCGKRFSKLSLLKSHYKTHFISVNSRKIYGCDYCNTQFTSKSNKNKHLRKYHLQRQ